MDKELFICLFNPTLVPVREKDSSFPLPKIINIIFLIQMIT